ncbi:MAG: TatD family hydrolase [Pseudomonadota bacterium]
MKEIIDIGVNLTNKSLLRELDKILDRAAAAGVQQMIVTGTTMDDNRKAIELCEQYPERLFSTCGIHPHHASEFNSDKLFEMKQMASNQCVRAIGETGLDFNRNYSSPEDQIRAFEAQLELAKQLEMPLFCHQRDAHQSFIDILSHQRDHLTRIVVHCFTDNQKALEDYLDLDCHIGITGWICDERRGLNLQKIVKLIPDNRLMIETDAPYLLPRNLEPKPLSRTNEPAHLPHILKEVAKHRNQDMDTLADILLENTRQFFDI